MWKIIGICVIVMMVSIALTVHSRSRGFRTFSSNTSTRPTPRSGSGPINTNNISKDFYNRVPRSEIHHVGGQRVITTIRRR